MSSIQDLRIEANKVKNETQPGGNTCTRIGNLYNGIIDFLGVLDERTVDPYYYDDTALKEAIARVNQAIADLDSALEGALVIVNQERQRLDDLINTLDSEIGEKVDDMLNDAQWLQEHAKGIQELVNEGEILWKSEWDQNVEAYLQEVGVWAREGDVIKTQWSEVVQSVDSITSTVAEVQEDLAGRPTSTQWTQISQKVNSIEQSVNALYYNPGSVEALQSSINQSVDGKVAGLKLETTYAQLEDMKGAKDVIKWMYSAFRNETGPEKSFNEIVSAGQSGFNNAIADIRTYVEEVKDGDVLKHVAIASMEAKVNESITGLYNEALAGEARSLMFSQAVKNTEDIATIITHATGDYSEADVATKFDKFRSGLITKTNADEAVSSLLAAGEETKSGIVVRAALEEATTDILSQVGSMTSGFLLTAKLGEATAHMVAQDRDSGATAAIVAKVNRSGSEIMLSADQVLMTNAFANKITANEAFIGYLTGGSATFSGDIVAKSLTLGTDVAIEEDNVSGLKNDLNGKVGLGKGYGSDSEGSNYTKIDPNGLLKARNAWISGTVYATNGEFTGKVTATSGEFRGTVYANAGEFTGKITANSGTIGGFTITDSQINSTNNQIILKKDGSATFKNISVTGGTFEGLIYAKNGLCLPVSYSNQKDDYSMPGNAAVHINKYKQPVSTAEQVTIHLPNNPNIGQQIIIKYAGDTYYKSLALPSGNVYFCGAYDSVTETYNTAHDVCVTVVYDGTEWIIVSYTCENILNHFPS